jgi:predicted thioesterase
MGRVGSCFDNVAAEAFFSTLEWEVLSRNEFTDPEHARTVVRERCHEFYNTQAMVKVAEVPGSQAMAFLAGLPRGAPGPSVGVAPEPRGLRATAPGLRDCATLAGTARLTSLRRVMRHVTTLSLWSHESGASGWVAEVGGGRITLLISP